MEAWGAVLALHILCAAIWVGGLFFAYIVLQPGLAGLDPAPRVALTGRVLKRFFLVTWHAMPLIILSGYAMLFGIYGGFAGADWTIHTMHGLGLIMAAIFVFVVFGPWRGFRTAIQPARAIVAGARIRQLLGVSLVLGIVTIVVASLGHW